MKKSIIMLALFALTITGTFLMNQPTALAYGGHCKKCYCDSYEPNDPEFDTGRCVCGHLTGQHSPFARR